LNAVHLIHPVLACGHLDHRLICETASFDSRPEQIWQI
jgi:hypothetical protein